MAIAISTPVTESILIDIIGKLIENFGVILVFRETLDRELMFEYWGTKRTSLNVSPSLLSNT